ncbi:MAG: DNA repair protein RadC [Saprospiraceae bacterium]|jgi:DNA repair protein RadC
MTDPQLSAIRAWAEEDRPREKFLVKGKAALSNAELLAILLGSGSRGESALALAQRMLASVNNNLHDLGRLQVADFTRFKGVGKAKAIGLAAALELGNRRQLAEVNKRPRISSSRDAYVQIAPTISALYHEEFWVLYLNRANELIGREQLSSGGTAGTVVDIKLFYKKAIDARASSVIAAHNHPSGNLQPSQADQQLTVKLRESGAILDLPLLDHLIVSEKGYYSFADEGRLDG